MDAEPWWPWWKALLGCVLAGALVLGLGSRLVMRIIAILAEPEYQGASTVGGNVVGQITLGGTIGMLVPGALGGLLAGVGYLLIRNWLPPNLVLRGLVFGGLTVVLFGGFLIGSGDNPDFRFTTPEVQIAMFGAVFLMFGLLASWLAERWGAGLPGPKPTKVGYVLITCVMVAGFAALADPTLTILRSQPG